MVAIANEFIEPTWLIHSGRSKTEHKSVCVRDLIFDLDMECALGMENFINYGVFLEKYIKASIWQKAH